MPETSAMHMEDRSGAAAEAVLDLTLATWDHDRAMALHDGRVTVPGVALNGTVAPTSKLFPLAVGAAPYDITEMSISSYILQVSRGVGEYVAIPVFLSRAFRHSGFFARAGSGIKSGISFPTGTPAMRSCSRLP